MKKAVNRARVKKVSYILATLINVILISTLCFIFILILPKKGVQADNTVYDEYVIEPGDTLWSIARENKEDGQDIREYIYEIEKLNNIDCDLQIGQVIKLIK